MDCISGGFQHVLAHIITNRLHALQLCPGNLDQRLSWVSAVHKSILNILLQSSHQFIHSGKRFVAGRRFNVVAFAVAGVNERTPALAQQAEYK